MPVQPKAWASRSTVATCSYSPSLLKWSTPSPLWAQTLVAEPLSSVTSQRVVLHHVSSSADSSVATSENTEDKYPRRSFPSNPSPLSDSYAATYKHPGNGHRLSRVRGFIKQERYKACADLTSSTIKVSTLPLNSQGPPLWLRGSKVEKSLLTQDGARLKVPAKN